MTTTGTALRAAMALGLRSSAHYLHYRAALKSGWVRRQTPIRSWESFEEELQLADPGHFFWPADQWRPPSHLSWSLEAMEQASAAGEKILRGEFSLFGSQWVELGFPPDWHSFPPLAGGDRAERVWPDRHWSTYEIDRLGADVKLLWEPSRMAWVYILGRAYRWTEREEFARCFWQLFESWCQSHQPNASPHWISAQEVAYRVIALGFASTCFRPWLDQAQEHRLKAVVRAHAARIPPTAAYSRAQRNNHLLSEAVGLLTAGLLFPGMPEAADHTRTGFRWLVAGLDDQIFADGGYIQHSANYGRLALELGLWANLLCIRNDLSLPLRSKQALIRLADWLGDMVEPSTGRVPNFGPNDGTQLTSLTSCHFSDFRPVLQAARATLGGKAPYSSGPWDELTSWLGTEPSPRRLKKLPARHDHPQAGIYSFGTDSLHGYLRAAQFSSRPGHVDQLHLDLWHQGRNLAMDPGTYLYNGEPPWDNQLAGSLNHNTAVVDGREPMERAGRFLWLGWSRARLLEKLQSTDGELELLTAVHDGYRSMGVSHQRSVLRAAEDLLFVIDDLAGEGEHEIYLPWLLPMMNWRTEAGTLIVDLETSKLELTVEGDGLINSLYSAGERIFGKALPMERPQWGWQSETYADKQPALHWISYWRGPLPIQIHSWWCFNGASPDQLELRWEDGALPQLRTIHLGGTTLRR